MTYFTEDVEIISGLADYPNDDDGLSADEFKAKFDEAVIKLKTFINETLIPEIINGDVAAASGIAQRLISSTMLEDGCITENKLSRTAGEEAVGETALKDGCVSVEKLSNSLQTRLTNVENGVTSNTGSIVTLNNTTSTLSTNVSTLTSGKQDLHKTATCTLELHNLRADWTVSADGVSPDNSVIITPAPASFAQWVDNRIRCIAQGDDSLTFTCDTNPSEAVTVNVLILD